MPRWRLLAGCLLAGCTPQAVDAPPEEMATAQPSAEVASADGISTAAIPTEAAPPSLATGVFLVTLGLPLEVDRWYQTRHRGAWPDTAWTLASVHVHPDPASARIGSIEVRTTEVDVSENREARVLGYALAFRPTEGRARPWIPDVGDWGYGIPTATRRIAGDWMALPRGVFGDSAWVRVAGWGEHESGLPGSIEAVDGLLLALDAQHGVPTSNSYLALGVDATHLAVRPEIPSDMPCAHPDDAPDPPLDAVPTHRVPIETLFDTDERPTFDVAHGRGC